MGLKPWELMALTPREFVMLVEHSALTEERRDYRAAWMSALTLKAWGAKGDVSPEKILGRPLRYLKVVVEKPKYPGKVLAQLLGESV